MLNILSLVLLVGILPPKAKDEFEDGAWCRKMDQDLNVADGKIKGVKDTSWTLKRRSAAGKMTSRTHFGIFGFEETLYGPDGESALSHTYSYTNDPNLSPTETLRTEKVIYDEHGQEVGEEVQDANGTKIGSYSIQYDANHRPLSVFGELIQNHEKTVQTISMVYDSKGTTETNRIMISKENGDLKIDQIFIRKTGLDDRLTSYEWLLKRPGETSHQTYHRQTYEYNDTPNANFYIKRTDTTHYDTATIVTETLLDKKNRPLSEAYLDNNSCGIRYEYVEDYDQQNRLIHFEVADYNNCIGGQDLRSKTVTDYLYRSQGIELVSTQGFDNHGKILNASRQFYSYCD